MMYDLPAAVEVCGVEYEVRSDYRAVLDICAALSDPDLNDQDKALVVLDIFYPAFAEMPQEHYNEAVSRCFWFINCGEEGGGERGPRLMDWEQDFAVIVAPVNRIMGREVRAMEYLHWWSFVAAYQEIGDCTFAQIVRVRERLAKGKPLDKSDREWYRKNRRLVDMQTTLTEQENEVLDRWMGKRKTAP